MLNTVPGKRHYERLMQYECYCYPLPSNSCNNLSGLMTPLRITFPSSEYSSQILPG